MARYLDPAAFVGSFAARPEVSYDDVHVDEFANAPSGPGEWVSAAIRVFAEAVRARDQLGLPGTVAMEVFLAMRETPGGIDFGTLSDLTNQLGWTPPELVLYRAGAGPDWNGESCREATGVSGLPKHLHSQVFLMEWRDDDEDPPIDRRVWLVAPVGISP